jgi:adenosylcobinamide-phosphate synthase
MVIAVRPLAAAAAIVADRVIGEPPAALHPVALFGRLMVAAERPVYRDSRSAGAAYAAAGIALGGAMGAILARRVGVGTATFAAAEIAIAGRMLAVAAEEVEAALADGDLDCARRLLPSLVGRNPEGLDETDIARAVVESIAENTVDAVVAPALWAAAFGAPGALMYRAVNTLDAMVGHRNARYLRFGWTAARLDDAAAWIPSRLTALLVAALRPRVADTIWRTIRADAPTHPSPNAGVAEAAFAAALGLRLGGANRYGGRVEIRGPLGRGRAPAAADIGTAVALARHVGWGLAAALTAVAVGAGVTGRRKYRR